MDKARITIDKRTVFRLERFTRVHPALREVASLGYIPRKSRVDVVQRQIMGDREEAYVVVLSGKGVHRLKGRTHRIAAPAVFRLTADRAPFEFRPDPEWEEFYWSGGVLKEAAPHIRPLGPADQPWWPLADPDAFRHGMHEILRLAEQLHVPGVADLVDRLCELLILRSIPSSIPQPRMRHQRELENLREQIDVNPRNEYAFAAVAGRLGITPGRFRDLWRRVADRPPHGYLLRARIREACRLLLETDWSIKEIARDVCFDDPYYFSRLFRQEMGSSPLAYRQRFFSSHI